MPELVLPTTPPLANAVVLIRPWRASDVPTNLMAFADPLVQRFSWARTTPYGEADARRFYLEQERARRDGAALSFAFADPADDTVVLGGGSLYDIDTNHGRAAIGFWLTPPARGRGVATNAVRLVASWAFEALGLLRLELTCAPDNLASQGVAERCGFTREGLLRSNIWFKGRRRDTVVFSLLPGERR